MKNMFSLVFLFSLVLLANEPLQSQVRVFFDVANPPFMYEASGQAAGLYPALLKEAFSRMKISVEIRAVPWRRALWGIEAGTNGIGGIYKNTERSTKWDYSAPFYEERLAVYMLKGKEFKFRKIDDLEGKKIGVIQGWSYGDAFDAAVSAGTIQSEEENGDENNFRKLAAGRLDAVVAVLESGDSFTAPVKSDSHVIRAPVLLGTNSVYLAFNKRMKMKAFLERFDEALFSMKKDGSFDSIVKTVIGR